MTDARHLQLIPRLPILAGGVYALGRCYRQFNRHVSPHRCCLRRWIL